MLVQRILPMPGFTALHLLEAIALLLLAVLAGVWRRRPAPRDRAELEEATPDGPAALSAASARDAELFERHPAAMLLVDAGGLITAVNPALCLLSGYAAEELIGQGAALLHRGERPFKPFRGAEDAPALDGPPVRAEHRLRCKDGSRLWVQILGAGMRLPDGRDGAVWSVVDVTALHRAQEQVHYQAQHDELTGLPNRRALEQQLPKAIARARRHGTMLAVGVIDLDDFKPVNDTWGHEAGDRLLVEVATRMRDRLRESDLIARSGGDEFVVVIEELHTDRAMQQLGEVLARLHGAVETPVEVVAGQPAQVGASAGIALYPVDALEADSLLRLADAAMYQGKTQKHSRRQWWRRGVEALALTAPEEPFDAYGEEARQLMARSTEQFEAVAEQFVNVFWTQIACEPPADKVLGKFSAEETAQLARQQMAYLRFLLDPATRQPEILARGSRVGAVHALIGIGSEVLVQALAVHRRLLGDYLNSALLPARDRYRILLGAETRLQDSMQAELRSLAEVIGAYLAHLSLPLPAQGSLWPDARVGEIESLARLPGILGALVMRLNAEGVFNVESSAGLRGAEIAAVLLTPGGEAVVHPDSARGRGTSAEAWRTLQIQTSADYARDPRYTHWHAQARELGLRSTLSVPVLNPQGQPVAMVSLFGAYPHQFESSTMQQFARGLQQRWQQLWLRCSTPAAVVPLDVAQDYRYSLFAGGLRIHMQPVVDLRSGALVKVEGLARLERPDGSLLAPAEFLPLLGDAELDRLFRLGLDIVLEQLVRWDGEGLPIQVALNLSSGTLLDPDCPRWVEQALGRHGVAAQRLTLELLETESIDAQAQEAAIRRLRRLGVQLSMDDLGTGHANLERWARLPFDTIKLDQSLLGRVSDNPVLMLSMIRAFVAMGRDIDRDVVVEGLEHESTIEAAVLLGANYGQGYGLGRPMAAEQILPWSRQFRLHRHPEEVHTDLGALAQVWRCLPEHGRGRAAQRAEDCPLGHYLARCAPGQTELARWHRDLHAGHERRPAEHGLRLWLVNRIQAAAAS